MAGEITLAGVTLTVDEWEALDPEARALLLEAAAAEGAADDELGLPFAWPEGTRAPVGRTARPR